MSFSFADMWSSMGLGAKAVVITLALMSIYSLGVMVERLLALSKSKKQSVKYAGMLNGMLAQGDTDHAAAAADSLKQGYLPRVLGAGLKEYHNVIDRPDQSKHDKLELTERAIDRTTQRTISDLRRGLGGLGTIGSSAPFVGLFGTVLGIINAFTLMAAKGSGGLATVSAGISEALVTTAFGLLVAIPAVAVYNYFTNTVDTITVDINDASSELLAYLQKRTPDAA